MRYTLSDREFDFFSQLIYRVNSLDNYQDIASALLKQLQFIISYEKGIVFQIRENESGTLAYQDPVSLNLAGISFNETVFLNGSYRSEWLSYTSSPWSSTFRGTDIREESEFLSSDLYKDIYRPQNLYYALQSILIHKEQKLALVGLFRSKEAGDFSDRDVYFLNALSPHLGLKLYSLPDSTPVKKSREPDEEGGLSDALEKKFGFTKRELSVVQLLCEGRSSQEISSCLFISKSTLDKHLSSIYRKTDVHNRVQLMSKLNQEVSETQMEA